MSETNLHAPTAAMVDAPVDSAPLAPRTTVVRESPRPGNGEPDNKLAALSSELARPAPYRRSERFGKLASALAEAQGEFSEIEKGLEAEVNSRREGARSYRYNYADLDTVIRAVRPALSKHGLSFAQFPVPKRGVLVVTTLLMHGESEQFIESDFSVALDSGDAQIVGSATTYAKRYGLMALLGIAAGEPDDDGTAASKAKTSQAAAPAEFDDWLTDLGSVADEGMERLQPTWATSNKDYRRHLTTTAPEKWTAIKARAAAAKKAEKH